MMQEPQSLRIDVDAEGRVSITGPIDQLPFCYGLLEIAKDILRKRAEAATTKVVSPSPRDVLSLGKH